MENPISIYLNSGNFSEGFNSITIQLNQTKKFTTTLPAAPKIPHLYKNWQQQYTSLTPTARAGFKKSQITHISSSECFYYYQALCQQLNIWFTPIKNLLPNSEKILLILNTQNISDYQTREILHKLPWGKIHLSENQIIETIFPTKKAPWNYARFLNYATEKMLLQRVGGGYRFIHRLLQERLAWRYTNQEK
ncbi:MAG: hypothetical protein F6K22_39895 [Okeania sp. SIO2F4]|uniref:hypothetical protein n=1 Tax=Okeania sp. SIO2F4 TaxID=2607790 RepID=UPI001429A785|nr:hypothetical protein [Okeania sp. SIO2F4]NES08375.1 hypothetical protein [Okeania sp. SIO2F4]